MMMNIWVPFLAAIPHCSETFMYELTMTPTSFSLSVESNCIVNLPIGNIAIQKLHAGSRYNKLLSPRAYCNTMYLISECEPMEVIIQRFINFANSLQNNEVLITIANVAKNNPFSTSGCNYFHFISFHLFSLQKKRHSIQTYKSLFY